MTRDGEEYDCKVCGGTHTVQVDRTGFAAIMGHIEYYVDCPEYGYIGWIGRK